MKRSIALSALVVLSLATNALAWGPDGHRIVCRIAYQLLDSDAQRAEVDRLVTGYKLPNHLAGYHSFPESCTFPDRARGNVVDKVHGWERFSKFDNWHFLNVPRTVHHVEDKFCHHDCVTHAVEFHRDELGDMHLDDQKRAEGLIFLGHWLGDIHQPLHISYNDDQGGNKIPVDGDFYRPVKFHSVWDSGIITKSETTPGAWEAYADKLESGITPAMRAEWVAVATPVEWADESYQVTTRPEARYCHWEGEVCCCKHDFHTRTLVQDYQDEFGDDVGKRLQQAGARLAELLRTRLTSPPQP